MPVRFPRRLAASIVVGTAVLNLFAPGVLAQSSHATSGVQGTLTVDWQVPASGAVFTRPVISDSRIFWGDFSGLEHATTLKGQGVWQTNLGVTVPPYGCPDNNQLGVVSSATVRNGVVYVAGGNNRMYALNETTGQVIWSDKLGGSNGFLWDSPLVTGGSVYIGEASIGDCPLVQGKLFKLNVATGHVQGAFDAAPAACPGSGIWGSPVMAGGHIFVDTGNPSRCKSREYGEALIELRTDLTVVGAWHVPRAQRVSDSDFGSTPTVFGRMVGALNKNGTFYAFLQGQLRAGPVWEQNVGTDTDDISTAAWDGTRLYVAGRYTTQDGVSCGGTLQALNPATGALEWRDCLPYEPQLNGHLGGVVGGVTVTTGDVVEVGDSDHLVMAKGTNGAIVDDWVHPGSLFFGAVSLRAGVMFVPDMAGKLFALSS